MGIRLFSSQSSSCGCTGCSSPAPAVNINPDPSNWQLVAHESCGAYTAVWLRYPNCTNYEGRKILVYKADRRKILSQKVLDPHFGQGSGLYPIARFEPTHQGWKDAILYIHVKSAAKTIETCFEK